MTKLKVGLKKACVSFARSLADEGVMSLEKLRRMQPAAARHVLQGAGMKSIQIETVLEAYLPAPAPAPALKPAPVPFNESPTCVATLQGHSSTIYYVAFHPSAPLLATGSTDKSAKLWRLSADLSAATCVATLEGHCGEVLSVAFHPSAPLLETGSSDQSTK